MNWLSGRAGGGDLDAAENRTVGPAGCSGFVRPGPTAGRAFPRTDPTAEAAPPKQPLIAALPQVFFHLPQEFDQVEVVRPL
jgi:hypothetical protein